jgi:hypothetical protein
MQEVGCLSLNAEDKSCNLPGNGHRKLFLALSLIGLASTIRSLALAVHS